METYVINLSKYRSIGTHWIVFCVNNNNVINFDSLGVKRIPKEIRKKL